MVREVLSSDPEIEVAGVAANGRIGLAMIEQLTPDAVTLDIDMPEMNGLEMLRVLGPNHGKPHVVIFSAMSDTGAAATLDAFALGADDYVHKPTDAGDLAESKEHIRTQLIPKLKALCGFPSASPATGLGSKIAERPRIRTNESAVLTACLSPERPPPRRDSAASKRLDLLVIGTSTGGPNALAELLPNFPETLPVPALIVQHMPPTFTRYLAERLSATCRVPVVEASEGNELAPGKIWIAPGDFHMTVQTERGRAWLEMNQQARENSCRPSVDVLFRSAAAAFGSHLLAVILTGMGQDGLRGCEDVRRCGGQILAQDAASSVVWGMPGFVANAGLADKVAPLAELGPEILRRLALNRHREWN